jgi:hypothetical protein
MQGGRLHAGGGAVPPWRPRAAIGGARRRVSVQHITPPQQMDEERLRQARVEYREEVLRIMQKKRAEMEADGYLL